ncbi:tetratricopeptide repeat protein [Azospirillum sp. SYSU D00513]|uniref:tetratricopeptide repeat protein n=1 Tax=Azospirillum sp. SYSU D00513 TaxID=2812561 RepID=UPI001A978A6A|nr:tetratricopeptide repeat protein [Azospirillum sp. SYSU D00513]
MATLLDALDAAVNHHVAGRLGDAERLYRLVLAVEPGQPDALHLHGVLEAQRGRPDVAVARIRRSLRLHSSAAACAHLGGALRSLGRMVEARHALRRALALDPTQADGLDTLGTVDHAENCYGPAVAWLSRAALLRAGHAATLTNLGTVLRDQRRFAEAEAVLSSVLARHPTATATDAGMALAVSRLVRGDLRGGWRLFESWRWKRFNSAPWLGEPLKGETILLHAEQGFGDTIQFARYVPLVAQAGGRVVLEVPAPLYRLLGVLPGVQTVVQGPEPPPHDRHCPLITLPLAFGTDLDGIPAPKAYLAADPSDVRRARARFDGAPFDAEAASGDAKPLRVGLVWAGNPKHRNDHNRSIAPERLRPLFAVPGVRFFSLQAGPSRAALPRLPGSVTDVMEGVRDFADTAGILAHLDLVIAVDTAVVHLAGALGVPAWLLLPYAPDWRWLLDRPDSPWYPSLRLFRQPRPGDWDTALATVAAVLRGVAAGKGRARTAALPPEELSSVPPLPR